jgi:menaquinone-specific isochorismate synthase
MFWHQPADNMVMAGAGLTVSYEGSGESRFEQTGLAYRRLVSEAHVNSCTSYPLAAPVALGGFAFDPVAPPNPAWENHPDALLAVPRFLFLTANDDSWCTINLQVSAELDTDAAVEGVLAELVELVAAVDEPAGDEQPTIWPVTDDTSSVWADKVNCILEGIQRGEVQKVVLARELRLRGRDEIDVNVALRRLSETSEHCVLFAIDTASGCMLGATPERLVRLQGQTVEVDCLAGSTARGEDEDGDRHLADALMRSDKDRREHGWVVNTLREALMAYCSSLHVPDTPRLLQLFDVQHLHTPLQGTLNAGYSVLDLVARLHPTPGVGGVPRAEALDIIRRQERLGRGWYAGPIGWVDGGGSGEFVVGIRSALLRGKEAWLYAGCGIVKGSDPRSEYEESCLKLRPMLAALSETAS